MLQKILKAFNIEEAEVKSFGSGLINRTWKISTHAGNYILQKINDNVFKHPKDVAYNIRSIADYLEEKHPDYFLITTVVAKDGSDMVFFEEEGWFRLVPFVENSHTFDVVQTPGQAYEAAKQFGRFAKMLSGFDAGRLKITIPHFHNLALRCQQF
jgi:hypothetical protein